MRIAQISPLMEAVPPKFYGGTERIVAYLTDALVAMGHDANTVRQRRQRDHRHSRVGMPASASPRSYDPRPSGAADCDVGDCRTTSGQFDVIHLHCDYLGYSALRRAGTPFLATLHGRLDLPELKLLYEVFSEVPVVSISDAQRAPLPQAHYIGTVPHGLPDNLLLPGSGAGGYLAFLGRISPEKAPDGAIRIAALAGHEAEDRG